MLMDPWPPLDPRPAKEIGAAILVACFDFVPHRYVSIAQMYWAVYCLSLCR